MFSSTAKGREWAATGARVVAEELENQVRNDGSHFEESSYYHVYAVDMFLFNAILAEPGTGYRKRLESMADFLNALLTPSGDLPQFGDDDGGRFFYPFGVRSRFSLATLATCGVFLDRPEWIRNESDLAEQAIWWLGVARCKAALRRASARGVKPRANSHRFPDSGLVVMAAEGTHIVVDAGGLGRGSAGHSHADALSLVVHHNGQDLLIDPGTYMYVGPLVWRNRFRGTSAHNTVRIDNLDQADPAGPFAWRKPPTIRVKEWKSHALRDLLVAACFARGFEHRRTVLFDKIEEIVLIVDEISSEAGGEHEIEQFWHTGVAINQLAGRCYALGRDAVLTLSDWGGRADLLEDQDVGWRSSAFGAKTSAPVLRVYVRCSLPIRLSALLDLRGGRQSAQLTATGEHEWLYKNGRTISLQIE